MFPDGNFLLHFIDEPLARGKRLRTMARDEFDPKRGFIDFHDADAVDEPNGLNRPTVFHFIKEFLELVFGHGFVRFVVDSHERIGSFGFANDSRERESCSGFVGRRSFSYQFAFVDDVLGDGEFSLHKG